MNPFRLFFLLLGTTTMLCAQTVRINEFMALNASVLQDEDGDFSDWIELYNESSEPVNLAHWALTDEAANPVKWVFPSLELPANAYVVVFASGKDRSRIDGSLHTNFKLSGSGEYLALVRPDGTLATEFAPHFPSQQTDQSYGYYLGQYTPMSRPTPDTANELGNLLPPPQMSAEGGLQSAPLQLELSASLPSARILYTLDGRFPTLEKALVYERPIDINRTTSVGAICVGEDGRQSALVTRTFLFAESVFTQPEAPEGYPTEWSYQTDSTFFPSDYAMDADVLTDPAYATMAEEALSDIPSLCIVTDPEHLFSHSLHPDSGGIYIHTGKTYYGLGDGWERPASVEYYDPSSGKSFQINCGLLLHGGNSRNPSNTQKHSFRISFRKKYGASKLNFDLFPAKTATNRFDHLVLRAGYNYTWTKNGSKKLYPQNIIQRTHAQYIYDTFAKRAHLSMGHVATHSRFVHLYLNGLYWGLYDVCEKINNDFAQAYLGGDDADFDVVGDHNEVIDGTREAYNTMYKTATSVGKSMDDESFLQLQNESLLDIDNFIDYMLVNYYIGNKDWDHNNWRAMRSRVRPGDGFQYVVWDAETAFTDLAENRVGQKNGDPSKMMDALRKHPEFSMRCADRIYRHLFNGGILSPEGASALYESLAAEIDKAIVLESARWGDYRQDRGEAEEIYTRNDHWLVRKQDLMDNYFPYRTEIVLQQLKDYGLYPNQLDPPVFSIASGTYDDTLHLELSGNGTIYYTLDGTDPRIPYTESGVYRGAKSYKNSFEVTKKQTTIKARVLKDGQWSALAEATYRIELPIVDGLATPESIEQYVAQRRLHYYLSCQAAVAVAIYDMNGRLVAHLPSQLCGTGWHNSPELDLPSGVYLYRLMVGEQTKVGRFRLP